MTKAVIDLLPCPFCGGVAERVDIENGDNAGGSFVHCTVCDASGNVEFGFKENFIYNWNRRRSAVLEADALSDKIEDLLAEFGDDPRAALECVSEYLSLRRHSAALSVPAAAGVGEPVAWRYKLENWGPEYWQYFTKEPRHKEPGEVWQPLYAAPSAPDGWQPIETAPKDGGFLAANGREVWAAWHYDSENWHARYGSRGATHWRPLPPPPGSEKP